MALTTVKARNQNNQYYKIINQENVLKKRLEKLKAKKKDLAFKIGFEAIKT
jgi:hypothetical protein